MPDELEDSLYAQIQLVFPQLSERLIRNVTKVVRERNQVDGAAAFATLLPACIDVLLEMPQEAQYNHLIGNAGNATGVNCNVQNDQNYVFNAENGVGRNGRPIVVEDFSNGNESPISSSDDETNASCKRSRFSTKMRDLKRDTGSSSSSSPSPSDSSSSSSLSSHSTVSNNDDNGDGPYTDYDNGDAWHPTLAQKKSASSTPNHNNSVKASKSELIQGKKGETPTTSKVNPFKEAYNIVLSVIPDVEETYALRFFRERLFDMVDDVGQMANILIEYLFENPESYPKLKKPEEKISTPAAKIIEKNAKETDYFKVEPKFCRDWFYRDQSLLLLQQTFRLVSQKNLKSALGKEKSFAKAWKYIQTRCEGNSNDGMPPLTFLKVPRPSRRLPAVLHSELEKEKKYVEAYLKKKAETADHNFAESLNIKQYEEEGQLIECGCCFGEAVFEQMIQCIEGHLFCRECLQSYAREAIFGVGKMQLFCMTDGCDSSFPLSQLKKALDENMVDKYQERLQDESLKMAELPDLVRCPFCDFAAEVPEDNKVFKCQNTECMKDSCRYCKEPWTDHFGIPCSEVEKKVETNLRTTYEEKMSMAKIRTCEKCGCGFMKTDGCNKMTCRCGTTMCYICRKSRINYSHFCNHPRDPGHGCTHCTKCSLWTDPTEDDERAVKELKKEAEREAQKIKATEAKAATPSVEVGKKRPMTIGPPEEGGSQRKKKKGKHQRHHQHFY